MSLIVPTRRKFIIGLVGLFAAPAIVRASSLMPVKESAAATEEWAVGDIFYDAAGTRAWRLVHINDEGGRLWAGIHPLLAVGSRA